MKSIFKIGLTGTLILVCFHAIGQLSTQVTVQSPNCYNGQDGSYTVNALQGCFPPITLYLDSDTAVFNTLMNNGYDLINHGQSTSDAEAFSVWGGSSAGSDVYLATGYFNNTLTFDTTQLVSQGSEDLFLACFDANTGNLLWASSAGGPQEQQGYHVEVFNNKVYVTGFTNDTIHFDNLTIDPSGDYDGFIARYNLTDGSIDTAVSLAGNGYDYAQSLQVLGNEIYITGSFIDSINFGGNTLQSVGSGDVYVVKMDTNFNEIWSSRGGGSGFDYPTDLECSVVSGNIEKVHIVGGFTNTATFGGSTINSTGATDAFVASLNPTGSWSWAVSGGGGGSATDLPYGIDVTDNGDTIFVGGRYQGTLNFGTVALTSNGNYDGFIIKFDTAGNDIAGLTFGNSGPDAIYDIEVHGNQLMTFSGQISGSVSFGDSTYVSNGNLDAFMGKATSSLSPVWGMNLGGTGNDSYNAIHKGSSDFLHATGFFTNDASAYQSGLISAGGRDALVTKDTYYGSVDTSFTVSGLAAGQYTFTLTDGNGNNLIDTVVITQPDSLTLTGNVINATSSTANDGSIDLTVTGGQPGYTYSWSNGAITEDIDSLTTGTYCVTVTDTVGCVDSTCFFVDSVFVSGPLSVDSSISNLNCFGDSSGAIDLIVTGGVQPYSFSWNNGATSEDLTGLAAGTYTVTVTDNDTSTIIDSFTVTQPPQITTSVIITPPSSGTSNDGAINQSVNGGLPPYIFNWSNGETTEDIDSLMVGSYSVTITDSSGCMVVKTYAVDTIPALSLVSLATDVTCLNTNNGTIYLTVIGGVPPFSYSWSNSATSEDINGLAAGVYTVTVTDSANQTASLTDTVGSNPMFADPVVGPISGPASTQAWTNYNYSVPSSSGSAFLWSVTGGSLVNSASNAATIQWNAGPQGVINVSETDSRGCIGNDSLAVDIVFVGVEETHDNMILVYPNPVSDQINIRLPNGFERVQMTIIDLHGRDVYRNENNASGSLKSYDVSMLPSGSYFIQMRFEQKDLTITHPIIIK